MARRGTRFVQIVFAAVVLCVAGAARARAQSGVADIVRRGRIHRGARPPAAFYRAAASDPHAFEFRHGWLARAGAVRQNRQRLRAQGAFGLLNASAAAPAAAPQAATAVSGTLRYPTFLPFFSNTTAADSLLMDSMSVQNKFWGTAAAPPYSITTYYKEISVNRLTVTGSVIGRGFKVTMPDTFYSGGAACQGLCIAGHVDSLIREMLHHADSTVNFALYADTTQLVGGAYYVPGVVILDPQVGAECENIYTPSTKNIWAHRFSLSGWLILRGTGGGAYTTRDSINGHPVVVDDYIIQGGQGEGPRSSPYGPECSPGYLAPIGTVTHETGHLFGLPDLYDVDGTTEGLGNWDLMSSGNEQAPYRPAHMSAWSLAFLGWISEVPVTAAGTVQTGPIEVSDSAFIVPIAGTPDSEFFLLENRQPIGSDSMIHGPGLMIYHVDTVLISQRIGANRVNAGVPHGIWILEAAGDTGLNCTYPSSCNDRGDPGDPFPGSSGNPTLAPATVPAAKANLGARACVTIDSIQQVVSFGTMRFRVSFGCLVRFAVQGSGAVGASRAVDPINGTTFAYGDSVTLTASPTAGQTFVGWAGDTVVGAQSIKLKLARSFVVTATFAATSDVVNQLLTGTSGIMPAALQLLDHLGNNNGRFDLGDLVAWLDRNPGLATSPAVLKLLRRIHQ